MYDIVTCVYDFLYILKPSLDSHYKKKIRIVTNLLNINLHNLK